ncbi:MBL fold metallo-hydrolase [Lutibacter sp. A80]|uniref:MBL fold metallo-hydrolase n=1 Tax=Lutibacter sp. A80 TaxID=2918453 RepID=UPI001F06B223|nr:MBL fold metallo-hydrolase [Lutibacter sp. A80]UMB59125.1 MBL fold metallo-hydrolase [Lutibacter sp. A80]
MKLTILTENCAGNKFEAEHGLSYLVEHNNNKILFDTGATDVFLKNAKLLNIDVENEIETVVLSHGHWDHGGGLEYLNNKTLITHPTSFIKRYRKKDKSSIGLTLTEDQLKEKFKIIKTSKPYIINDNMVFLGEIPRVNKFEARTTSFIDSKKTKDFVPDDSALALLNKDEIIIVTGCSHSGICNIVDYAQKKFKRSKIKAVIGGFHLKENNAQTQKTIAFLKKCDISEIYPSHCTAEPALEAFEQEFKFNRLKTGMTLTFWE